MTENPSEGMQITLPPRPVATSTLVYIPARTNILHLVALRLRLPGRRLYLIENLSLPPHQAASLAARAGGQYAVRIIRRRRHFPGNRLSDGRRVLIGSSK